VANDTSLLNQDWPVTAAAEPRLRKHEVERRRRLLRLLPRDRLAGMTARASTLSVPLDRDDLEGC
jgi:predicted nuclease with RNAse H fold